MKKKLFILSFLLVLILGIVFGYNLNNQPKGIIEPINKTNQIEIKIDYKDEINKLKEQYQNDDIIAYIEIPNILTEPVVQTTDNDYYLHYDIYKKENITGAVFLDYRNNINDSKKLLIYSHSDPEGTLPFVKLNNYNKQDFYNENKYIYLIDSNNKRKYEVFSSYIETSDFDYVNLENFNGLTYKEHLEKLKNKSLIKTDINLDDNSKVLILQTCSFEKKINSKEKYQLVIAKEV